MSAIGRLLLGNGWLNTPNNTGQKKTVFYVGFAPRLCKQKFQKEQWNVRSWESSVEEEFIWVIYCRELGRVLEMAVESNWKEIARKELGGPKNTSNMLQLQWDLYKYYVEIRCQDTTSEYREPWGVCNGELVKCVDI
jgi:hypothetical protein